MRFSEADFLTNHVKFPITAHQRCSRGQNWCLCCCYWSPYKYNPGAALSAGKLLEKVSVLHKNPLTGVGITTGGAKTGWRWGCGSVSACIKWQEKLPRCSEINYGSFFFGGGKLPLKTVAIQSGQVARNWSTFSTVVARNQDCVALHVRSYHRG